jgi:hypothetical protein
MMKRQAQDRSHLFVVRLWSEEVGGGQIEYRGKVQHMLSSEIRHFRDWTTLQEFFVAQVKDARRRSNAERQEDTGKE